MNAVLLETLLADFQACQKQLESDWASRYHSWSVRQNSGKIQPNAIHEHVKVDFKEDFGLNETGDIVSQRNIEKEKIWQIQMNWARTRAHRVVSF